MPPQRPGERNRCRIKDRTSRAPIAAKSTRFDDAPKVRTLFKRPNFISPIFRGVPERRVLLPCPLRGGGACDTAPGCKRATVGAAGTGPCARRRGRYGRWKRRRPLSSRPLLRPWFWTSGRSGFFSLALQRCRPTSPPWVVLASARSPLSYRKRRACKFAPRKPPLSRKTYFL